MATVRLVLVPGTPAAWTGVQVTAVVGYRCKRGVGAAVRGVAAHVVGRVMACGWTCPAVAREAAAQGVEYLLHK